MLSDASIVIAACGLKLTRFCMGTACPAPAVSNGNSFALTTQAPVDELLEKTTSAK
jgi:hypothetical protein